MNLARDSRFWSALTIQSTSRFSLLQLVWPVLEACKDMICHDQQLQEEVAALRSVRAKSRLGLVVLV
jgi:hypothetical protein